MMPYIQRRKSTIMTDTRCTIILVLVHVALLSILLTASSSAYTPNASTNRYLKEMGRLLRDPHLQAYAPAQTLESSKTEQVTSTTKFKDYPPAPTSFEYHQPQPPSNDPYGRLDPETDLFDALNQHIEALDQQIQTSRSRQPEFDYEYNSYIERDGIANEPSDSYEKNLFGRSYNDETSGYYYSSPSEQNSEYYETTAYYQPPEEPWKDSNTKSLNTNKKLTFDSNQQYLAEELFETIQTDYCEMESEYEFNEYDYQQNERPVYENEHEHKTEPVQVQEQLSIQKRKGIPQLPITNDPFQLLGLDYDNPPKTEKDIKRAFLKMAKKYHPDTISKDATAKERDAASIEFARINHAYQMVKEMLKQYEADRNFNDSLITTGGPMYDRRSSHIRKPFSRANGSSAKHKTQDELEQSRSFWGRRRTNQSQYGEPRTPFRYRQDVGDSCHVGVSYPPFHTF